MPYYPPTEISTITDQQLPSPSGGDDLAAINSMITTVAAAGGGKVRGREGSTYRISGPIIIKSNVTLDMTDCTIQFTSTSVHTNMLQNSTVTAASTATDASVTAGSSVVTSATLAAVAQGGQSLAVVGAGPPGGDGGGPIWLYGTVSAVNAGANQITLSGNTNGVASHITGSSKTAYLFNRDSDITIVGGTWDTGANWNALATRTAAGYDSHLLRFRRLDRLNVRNVKLTSGTFTGGLGWAFGINPADCTDFVIENCRGVNSSTVVQGDGPLARGIVRNIQGVTQDDMVAFGCVDFQGNDTEGDITGILVDGVETGQAQTAVKLFAGTGANSVQRINKATVRAVKGGQVLVIDYAGSGPIYALIEDVVPGSGQAGIVNTATYSRITRSASGAFVAQDAGLQLTTCDPADATSTFQPGTGVITLLMAKAPTAVTVANLLLVVTTAGATLTANQCLAGIYDQDGNLRAATANQATAWASTGLKTMALTAQGSYSLTLPGGPGVFYRIAILAVGTTIPIFASKAGNSVVGFDPSYAGSGSIPRATVRAGYYTTTSQTSLPSSLAAGVISPNGQNAMPWVGAT